MITKLIGSLLIIGALAALIVSISSCTGNAIGISRDIDQYKNRAQVSADATTMQDYLKALLQHLDDRGMKDGYGSFWTKSPWTDMMTIRQNIETIIERLDTVKAMDKTSETYAQNLDDIRGTLREVTLHAYGNWVYAQGGWLWSLLGILGFPILLAGGLILWSREPEPKYGR